MRPSSMRHARSPMVSALGAKSSARTRTTRQRAWYVPHPRVVRRCVTHGINNVQHDVRHATAACALSSDRPADSTAGAQMARALQRVARMSVADLASACEGASLEDLAARVDEAAAASGASADDFADDEAVAMAVECAAAIADGDADAVHDVASAAIAEAEERTCVRDALVRALVKTEQIDGTDAQLLASLDTERAAEILAAAGLSRAKAVIIPFIRSGSRRKAARRLALSCRP